MQQRQTQSSSMQPRLTLLLLLSATVLKVHWLYHSTQEQSGVVPLLLRYLVTAHTMSSVLAAECLH